MAKFKPMTAAELFYHLQRDHNYASINRPLKAHMEAVHYRMHHPLLPAHGDHDEAEWQNVSPSVTSKRRQER